MYHYLYTNDMRVSTLEDKAEGFAKMFLRDTLPSAKENKSLNNNANTVGFYLSLINKGNCANLAAKGDVRTVILNFIKTFQYPNPRTKESFENALNDGIKVAPMREIIKILFLFSQIKNDEVYLTDEEILNFIFYNDDLAKNSNPNRVGIINQIEEYRLNKKLGNNIAKSTERNWKHQDRQIKELLNVLEWSKFVRLEKDKVYFILPKDDDEKYKAELLDVIMFNDFWEDTLDNKEYKDLKESYIEYCDSQLNYKNISNETFDDIVCNKLERNVQRLYFGAPGTGKSYGVTKLISKCYPDIEERENPFIFKTTVYSDYSYYNFVGNIMPVTKDGEIGYDFTAGIFTKALVQAFEYPQKDIFLVIEEMSRTDIAAVFGDIFQLLDRDEFGKSEYSINNDLITYFLNKSGIEISKIVLPSNLHIIGTVNTSDQNVNVIDTAFKRRFDFIYSNVKPVKDIETGEYKNTYIFTLDGKEFEWNKLYMALNKFIVKKLELSEDKQIGQFFIKFDLFDTEKLKYEAIQNKLLHYLWEDVQNAAISDEYKIFDNDTYFSFSILYDGFKNKKNVFSKKFIEVYDEN